MSGIEGRGKTSFLKHISFQYHQRDNQVVCLDLDQEIQNTTGLSIGEIFVQEGEQEFRKVEVDTLKELIYENSDKKNDCYIAVGAGYSGPIPKEAFVIWLRRETDALGRVFLDRPRLK